MSDASFDLDLGGPVGKRESKWAQATAWVDDRLNPVLVKEVRQSLRGKQFRSAFLYTVIMSLIVAVAIVLLNSGRAEWNPIGPSFFQGIFICLTIAVIGFVPMSAFTAMGAEWEENTYDLLILSHLRPRHIVIGKLLGAGAQALLYFSVFSPYIVFTFLLGGVDLKLVMVTLPMLAVISLALSALAAGLSSLTDKRMGRVFLMVLLSAALVGACSAAISMMLATLELGLDFSSDEVQFGITAILLLALIVGGFAVAIAVARLSHPEENRSTGLRVLTFVLAMTCLAWVWWANSYIRQPEFVAFMTSLIIIGVMVLGLFFATEREALGLRVKNHLPNNPLLRAFAFPWLPGGARGAVWVLLTLGITSLFSWTMIQSSAFPGFRSASVQANPRVILALVSYGVFYLFVPSALFTNKTKRLQRSTLARVMVPALLLGGLLFPTMLGFIFGSRDLVRADHLGNPFIQVSRIYDGEGEFELILALGVLGLILQIPRVVRAIREVVRAPHAGGLATLGTGVASGRVSDPLEEVDSDA